MERSVLGELDLHSSLYVPAASPSAAATAAAATFTPRLSLRSTARHSHSGSGNTGTGTGTGTGDGTGTDNAGSTQPSRRRHARASVTVTNPERDSERSPRPRARAGSLSAASHRIGLPAPPPPPADVPLRQQLQSDRSGRTRDAHAARAHVQHAAADRERGSRARASGIVRSDSQPHPSQTSELLAGGAATRGEYSFVHPPITLANIALGSVLPRELRPPSDHFMSGVGTVSPLSPPPGDGRFFHFANAHPSLLELRLQQQTRRASVREPNPNADTSGQMFSASPGPGRPLSQTPSPGRMSLQNAPLSCVAQVCSNHVHVACMCVSHSLLCASMLKIMYCIYLRLAPCLLAQCSLALLLCFPKVFSLGFFLRLFTRI